jgi:hypothetical protein
MSAHTEKTPFTAANVPAFMMSVLREILPGGTILTRKGLTQFLLTLPKSRGVVLFQKARTIALQLDDDSSKKLYEAFQSSDEASLAECGELILTAVQSHFRQYPSAAVGAEVIQICLFPEQLQYRRA